MIQVEQHVTVGLQCLTPRIHGATIELPYKGTRRDGSVITFTEVIELPGSLDHVDRETRDGLVRLLSFAASPSYFKAFAPGTIEVPEGVTAVERTFLEEVTSKGLGEFAFVNDLPQVLTTPVTAAALPARPVRGPGDHPPRRVLVAVGGGKDSIVSIEALRSAGLDIGLFSVNGYIPIQATANVAGIDLQSATRRLDPQLFSLNAEGAPNGHVPVTAVNSVVALLSAMALGYDTVVFSNESSSSYGNVVWHNQVINHQWSKSAEFERLLRASLPDGSPNYVSLLRPLSELRIARRFATHRQYHPIFTSCNRAFKLNELERASWCGDCPKCRFVFLSLAPFMPRADLLAIFGGRDLFADPAQTRGFLELLGVDDLQKPFECVGEPDECRVAISFLRESREWRDHPFLATPELSAVVSTEEEVDRVVAFRTGEHCLPDELETLAREI